MAGVDQSVIGEPQDVVSAFDQLPLAVTCYEGPDLVLRAANGLGRAAFGDRPLVGLPAAQGLAETASQGFITLLQRVYRTGGSFSYPRWRTRRTRANGTIGEYFIAVDAVPWLHEDGTVRGVLCITRDLAVEVPAHKDADAHAEAAGLRHERARDVTTALQQALLPRELPVLPAVNLAARYLLAAQDTAAGGDWFDALPLPDGSVALVVGDVVGHGAAASAAMGYLRAVIRDRLLGGERPAQVVEAVDRFARHTPGAAAATVCVAVLDPGTAQLEYCCAGHPAPLIVDGRGAGRFLPIGGNGPLATAGTFRAARARLRSGEVLLLYSDGIVELPGVPATEGADQLARVAAAAAAGRLFPGDAPSDAAERVCADTLEVLTRTGGYSDDVTLLAAELAVPPADLDLTLPAEPRSLQRLRSELGLWLLGLRVDRRTETALQHAAVEAVTNAIEHAYRDPLDVACYELDGEAASDSTASGGDTVVVKATLTRDGTAEITFRDHGTWKTPDPTRPYRGNGLAMAAAFVDSVDIASGQAGTTVTLRRRLGREVRLDTVDVGSGVFPVESEASLDVRPDPQNPGWMSVRGTLDVRTAPGFTAKLRRATANWTIPLALDLTDVTHLASIGVHLPVRPRGRRRPAARAADLLRPARQRRRARPGPRRLAAHDQPRREHGAISDKAVVPRRAHRRVR